MKTHPTNKWYLLLASVLVFALPLRTALADDTEIYVGNNAGASVVKPNVLFIIDTSGSMGESVTYTAGTYDPSHDYSADGTCVAGRIYWSSNGNAPSCSTSKYFTATANKCNDSAAALASGGTGFYIGTLARYQTSSKNGNDTSNWVEFDSSDHTSPVECEQDYGNHGDGVDTTKLYPAKASKGGPWRANSTNAKDWNSTGASYTLYTANYLNWYNSAGSSVTSTRLQIVKDTFTSVINSTSGINAGLMRFDQSNAQGGYFLQGMQELNSTNRPTFISSVTGLNASGNTPLAETLYEASLYFRGQTVKYGDSSGPATNISSVLDTSDTSKYKTPMEYQCQKNFIVYMTDGAPTSDSDADSLIEALPGFSTITGSSTCSGNCLDELAQWMYKTDLNSALNDTQNVSTYTIGLNINLQLLQDTATKSGGKYYTMTGAVDLSNAFTSILTNILAVNTTFIAPAVTVNAFNRLNNRDDLFYAVFKPAGSPNWPGNVKHYKLAGNPAIIVDANGAAAIDVNTGFFSGTSTSYWTLSADAPDGDNVTKGGATGMLTTTRNLYTYVGATAPSDVALTAAGNVFNESNTSITNTLLNIGTQPAAYRTGLLQWARGIDVLDENTDGSTTDARRVMGDILHSKPLLMTYGGTDANPDMTLFVGTNEGFLHAINASTGVELFAFIPKELLPNLDTLYQNLDTEAHPYGMDGPLSLWHKDLNHNGVLLDSSSVVETGEHLYLYAGMRRGGNHYYALDVTNRNAPVLKWQIDGGTGNFAELGQSWSRPVVAKIKLNNVDKDVLIFAGGYDTNQDTTGAASDDTIGHAIYIVDATTGQRLWWASSTATANLVVPDMTNSIPADVKAIDINVDGYVDRLYVADTGARVFRIDFNLSNTGAANFATGGVLAYLGDTGAANNRRFYYAPDVVLDSGPTGQILRISLGSGYREHPLDTSIEDRFYSIIDTDVYAPPADNDLDGVPDYPAYTESDLYDATDNDLGQATGAALATAQAAFNSSHGWYISLVKADGTYEGEKVLASALTYNNILTFTTFTPVVTAQAAACAPSQGTAKAYSINLSNATPAQNLVNDGIDYSVADRATTLVRGGIPPEPTIVFLHDQLVFLCGTEQCRNGEERQAPKKAAWKQVE